MQVNRGSGVGKTFALAKLNDSSGGKKSKRRSKEERKGMVETFIKTHQASNKGSFPSLHLTHKQVGGSYYTVREIFRELIQENRVLAPPKLPPGEQNMENLDSFLENYPLRLVSFDPNVHGLPSKDNQTLLNEYEFRREKALNSIINTHSPVKNEEFEEQKHTELLMEQVMEGQKEEPYQGQIRHLSEDVVVETFPLRPVSSTVYDVDEKTSEKVVDGDLELANGDDFHNSNKVLDTNLEEELVSPKIKNHLFTDENTVLDVNNITDVKDENASPNEDKASSIPSGISSQHLDSNNSSSSLQQSIFKEITANKNKSDIKPSGSAQKQTDDTTLNRINLESREAASNKSDSQETNPIVSFIKTFVTAFIKFWSE